MGSLLDVNGPASSTGSDLSSLLQSLLALAIVGLLAWVCLRFLAARGFGKMGNGQLQVEARMMLDARSGLLVLRVEGRRLLLATHADAPARLLVELDTPAQRAASADQPGALAP
jgi:flagellar biogenesis protein FliO